VSTPTLPASEAGIKPTRRMRRVLTVLLTGAGNLGGGTFWRLTGVTAYAELARLERAGWVTTSKEPGPVGRSARTFYHLTPDGRTAALKLLKLQ
jgi:hypothetical protein